MNELKVDGIVKIFLNNKELLERENTWTNEGLDRVKNLLAGLSANTTTLEAIVVYNPSLLFFNTLTLIEKGPSAASLNVLWCYSEKSLTPECCTIREILLRPSYGGNAWSTINFSPYITIPTGWTFRVEWRNTFTGTDYTSQYLKRIPYYLNTQTNNTNFPPYSIGLFYAPSGTTMAPISETICTSDLGNTVVIYKGSFIINAISGIGTILTYRDIQYSHTAVTPFDKGGDTELHIEHRNTISQ